MSLSQTLLKLGRRIHLYTGLFIAPAILFLALTGALQTFKLHEPSRTSDYAPPTWIVRLSRIHKDQTATIPVRRPRPAETPKPHIEKPFAPPAPEPSQKSHLPLKIFFLLVSLGLFTSTLTGIYMAYRFNNNKLVVTALLLAGVLVPLLLLPF